MEQDISRIRGNIGATELFRILRVGPELKPDSALRWQSRDNEGKPLVSARLYWDRADDRIEGDIISYLNGDSYPVMDFEAVVAPDGEDTLEIEFRDHSSSDGETLAELLQDFAETLRVLERHTEAS